jgi:6-phosphogluconolactonase (cycloisomerase 2 family)
MHLFRRLVPILVLLALVGCNGGGPQNRSGPASGNSADGGGGAVVAPTVSPVPPGFVVSLAIVPPSSILGRGATEQLEAVAVYADATHHNVTHLATWSSSNASVATVSGSGRLTTGLPGQATVSATFQGVTATALVAVVNGQLTALAVTPGSASLVAGLTRQFTATATFSDGQQIDVTAIADWTSSDPSVATVSNATRTPGLAEGRAPGSVTITARFGAFAASATLTVTPATVVSVSVTPPTASDQVGNSVTFTATATLTDGTRPDVSAQATWASGAPAVATVNGPVATAVSPGTAPITASFGGQTGQATLTVTAAVLQSIEVRPANATLAIGSDEQYTAIGHYDDGATADITARVGWSSSNPTVAAVSPSGLVLGAAAGTSTITATLGAINGSTGLTVAGAGLVSIAISPPDNASLATGTTRGYTATGTFSDGHTADVTEVVTWSSSSPAIASVSNGAGQRGFVTGHSNGVATVSATEGAISASVRVRVMLYLYGTGGADVAAYAIDPTSGDLTLVNTASPGPDACICAFGQDPLNRFLFTVDGTTNELHSYRIDGATGAVTLLPGSTPVGDFANSISVTPDGRFLYVSEGGDATVSGFSIDPTSGALTPIPGGTAAAGEIPSGAAIDPTGRFLYVTDANTDSIFAFAIDPQSGALSTVPASPFPTDDQPVSVAVDPSGDLLFVSTVGDGRLDTFTIGANGALTAASQTAVGGQPYNVIVDPLGAFVYNADFSDYLVNGFRFDLSGTLTPIPGQPFDALNILPTGLAIDDGGRFLYLGSLVDPTVVGYAINGTSGALTPLNASGYPVNEPFEFLVVTR